ncbi:type VI secretion-associated protein, partial [Vibrio parahaemolyticus V-223/04]
VLRIRLRSPFLTKMVMKS